MPASSRAFFTARVVPCLTAPKSSFFAQTRTDQSTDEAPSGNARALSYAYEPIVRMSNTFVAPGDRPAQDIIAETERGIYAIGFLGGQTNIEMFTFTPEEAFLVENGKLTRKVRDLTLTGNVFTTLDSIDAIGNDLSCHDGGGGCGKAGQFPLPVTHGSPHVRIQNVVIGGE